MEPGIDQAVRILRPRRGATVLEVGACDGDTTLRILRQLEPECLAAWHLFEPDPRNLQAIRRNFPIVRAELGARGAIFDRVHVHAGAVADHVGDVTLRLSQRADGGDWSASSTICQPGPSMSGAFPWLVFPREVTVSATDLDSFCAREGIGHVDLLWCDAEGAEQLVFAGARRILAETEWLFTEVWERPLFEGQFSRAELLALLPDYWWAIETVENNYLLQNRRFA